MTNPHLGPPLQTTGPDAGTASVTVVAVHGRDQDPAWIREHLVDRMGRLDVTYLLPAADGRSWYPGSFLTGRDANQPRFGWALDRLDALADDLRGWGVPPERTVWIGFSQGACLLCEWLVTRPSRLRWVALLTGGLFGPIGDPVERSADLTGVATLIGTGDPDELVPVERVRATATVLADLGAAVDLRVYPGLGHAIGDDEIEAVGRLVDRAERAP